MATRYVRAFVRRACEFDRSSQAPAVLRVCMCVFGVIGIIRTGLPGTAGISWRGELPALPSVGCWRFAVR